MSSTKPQSKKEYIQKFEGQKASVICARYQYRGIVSHVGEDFFLLSDPVAVEISGPAQSERANTEDPIGCTVCISFDAVEMFYQPKFALAPLPSEEGWTPTNRDNS